MLPSSFYETEVIGEEGDRAWKIALKDHITQTLESICLIKKLSPVPPHIIEKKRLPIDLKPSGNIYYYIRKKISCIRFG